MTVIALERHFGGETLLNEVKKKFMIKSQKFEFGNMYECIIGKYIDFVCNLYFLSHFQK